MLTVVGAFAGYAKDFAVLVSFSTTIIVAFSFGMGVLEIVANFLFPVRHGSLENSPVRRANQKAVSEKSPMDAGTLWTAAPSGIKHGYVTYSIPKFHMGDDVAEVFVVEKDETFEDNKIANLFDPGPNDFVAKHVTGRLQEMDVHWRKFQTYKKVDVMSLIRFIRPATVRFNEKSPMKLVYNFVDELGRSYNRIICCEDPGVVEMPLWETEGYKKNRLESAILVVFGYDAHHIDIDHSDDNDDDNGGQGDEEGSTSDDPPGGGEEDGANDPDYEPGDGDEEDEVSSEEGDDDSHITEEEELDYSLDITPVAASWVRNSTDGILDVFPFLIRDSIVRDEGLFNFFKDQHVWGVRLELRFSGDLRSCNTYMLDQAGWFESHKVFSGDCDDE